MTSVLASAFAQGFTAQQVIQYLIRHSPQHAKQIARATGVGYTPNQILKYLTKDNPKERAATTEYEETRNRDNTNRTNANKAVIGGAVGGLGLGAGLSALGRGGAAIRGQVLPALPQTPQLPNLGGRTINIGHSPIPIPPNPTPTNPNPVGNNPGQPNVSPGNKLQTPTPQPTKGNSLSHSTPINPTSQPPANQVASSIPQAANIEQPKGFNTNIIRNGVAYKSQIDALIKSGNGPEEIEAYLKKFSPQAIKTIEKEGKGAFRDVVTQYMQEQLRDEAMQPEGSIPNVQTESIQPQLQEAEPLQEPIEQPEVKAEAPKIEKNSVVSSPNGVGELKELRNGVGLVEVDGKLHKVKEEDLEASPMPEKDLAELYDDLISGIESETGEDVSRMVQWAGYNPTTNTLQFLPHSGKLYKYGNISQEDAALLTDILSTRKTSGANFIGAWKAGSKSPIGAALSKLIRKLQSERGGKGNEYEETHEPIYSAYEPAIEAKKAKKKKK